MLSFQEFVQSRKNGSATAAQLHKSKSMGGPAAPNLLLPLDALKLRRSITSKSYSHQSAGQPAAVAVGSAGSAGLVQSPRSPFLAASWDNNNIGASGPRPAAAATATAAAAAAAATTTAATPGSNAFAAALGLDRISRSSSFRIAAHTTTTIISSGSTTPRQPSSSLSTLSHNQSLQLQLASRQTSSLSGLGGPRAAAVNVQPAAAPAAAAANSSSTNSPRLGRGSVQLLSVTDALSSPRNRNAVAGAAPTASVAETASSSYASPPTPPGRRYAGAAATVAEGTAVSLSAAGIGASGQAAAVSGTAVSARQLQRNITSSTQHSMSQASGFSTRSQQATRASGQQPGGQVGGTAGPAPAAAQQPQQQQLQQMLQMQEQLRQLQQQVSQRSQASQVRPSNIPTAAVTAAAAASSSEHRQLAAACAGAAAAALQGLEQQFDGIKSSFRSMLSSKGTASGSEAPAGTSAAVSRDLSRAGTGLTRVSATSSAKPVSGSQQISRWPSQLQHQQQQQQPSGEWDADGAAAGSSVGYARLQQQSPGATPKARAQPAAGCDTSSTDPHASAHGSSKESSRQAAADVPQHAEALNVTLSGGVAATAIEVHEERSTSSAGHNSGVCDGADGVPGHEDSYGSGELYTEPSSATTAPAAGDDAESSLGADAQDLFNTPAPLAAPRQLPGHAPSRSTWTRSCAASEPQCAASDVSSVDNQPGLDRNRHSRQVWDRQQQRQGSGLLSPPSSSSSFSIVRHRRPGMKPPAKPMPGTVAAPAAGAVGSGGDGHMVLVVRQHAKQLQQQNDALVRVLERERQQHDKARQQVADAQQQLKESRVEWEVALQGLRQDKAALAAQLRRALAGGDQQGVMDAYDAALAASAARVDEAQAAAAALAGQLAESELQLQQLQHVCSCSALARAGVSRSRSSSPVDGCLRSDTAAVAQAVAAAEGRSPARASSGSRPATAGPQAAAGSSGSRGLRALRQHQKRIEQQLAKQHAEMIKLERENIKLLRFKKQYEVAANKLQELTTAQDAAAAVAQEAGLRAAAATGRADRLQQQVDKLQQEKHQLVSAQPDLQQQMRAFENQLQQVQQSMNITSALGHSSPGAGRLAGTYSSCREAAVTPRKVEKDVATSPQPAATVQVQRVSSSHSTRSTRGSQITAATMAGTAVAAGDAERATTTVAVIASTVGASEYAPEAVDTVGNTSSPALKHSQRMFAAAGGAVWQPSNQGSAHHRRLFHSASMPAKMDIPVGGDANAAALSLAQQVSDALPVGSPMQAQLSSLMSAIAAGVEERKALAAQGQMLLEMVVGGSA